MTSQNRMLIVDVESTCWEAKPPPGQQSEIIEIGICALDWGTLQISQEASILVKPARSRVSPFCTQLTSLTQELVDQGVTFAEACARLETDYASNSVMWGSWGVYDLRMFQDQCASFGVPYPFGAQHLNIKKLFGERVNKKKQVGMAQALNVINLPLKGSHHRGGDDAHNIAVILGWMIKRFGAEILPIFEAE